MCAVNPFVMFDAAPPTRADASWRYRAGLAPGHSIPPMSKYATNARA